MKGAFFLPFFLLLAAPYLSFTQELSYTHYDIADGLASSTVYCITQDRDGFIWMGTEAGVCRFDGKQFLTFTSTDGLPDAEVLQMFGDSKGRVWMAPFRGSVAYYYQGKFHNPGNDKVLAAVGVRQNVKNFAEDSDGNILVQEAAALHIVHPDGRVKSYDSVEGKGIDSCSECARNKDGHFTVQIASNLFELSDTGFRWLERIHYPYENPNYMALTDSWAVWRADVTKTEIQSLVSGKAISIPYYISMEGRDSHISYSMVGDSTLYLNEFFGTLEYNLHQAVVVQRLLPARQVSRVFGDRAGNLWLTTLRSGIYRLNSAYFKMIRFPDQQFGESSITFIGPNLKGDKLILGDNHNTTVQLSLADMRVTYKNTVDYYGANRILFVHQMDANRYLYGSDATVSVRSFSIFTEYKKYDGIKAACVMDDGRVLIGGTWGAGIFDLRSLRLTKRLWNSRISAVYCKNDTNYIGTLNGLWMLAGTKPPQYLGETVDFLKNRIAAVTESEDGMLWVASNDGG